MMYLSATNKNETIKSNELVEIINQFREMEGGKSELQHKTFIEKIRNEIKTLESLGLNNQQNFLPVEYVDAKGEKRPCFELTRDGMLQMLNSESVLVRHKTIEYINVLEEKVTKQPIGVMENLQLELQIIRQELAELKEMTYISKQLKMLKSEKTLQSELKIIEETSHIEDETIIEIIRASMPLGYIFERKGNIILDRIVVIETAEKMGVDKGTLNKKLKLMGISVIDKDGSPCPKEYMPKFKAGVRCYVIKKNQI